MRPSRRAVPIIGKISRAIIALIAILPGMTAAHAPAGPQRSPVLVAAHRACWKGAAPENSLAAIRRCISMGVDIVELDVRRTADGALILMHDSTVDRTTNGHGAVNALTFAQVRALRLRMSDGRVTDESPPTFGDAMRLATGRILVNLDAKADVYDDAFAVIERTGTQHQIIMKRRVTASDRPLAVEAPFNRVLAMPIVDEGAGPAAALLANQRDSNAIAVELIFTDIDYLRAARRHLAGTGKRIWVNSLKPEQAAGTSDENAIRDPDRHWGRLIEEGVDIIQTDEPHALLRYLEGRGRRSRAGEALRLLHRSGGTSATITKGVR